MASLKSSKHSKTCSASSGHCSSKSLNEVVILSGARTPIGSFLGSLSPLSAPELASIAIKAALERAAIPKEEIKEAYIGHVLQAGAGQAPARQAVIFAGLPETTICTTVNKVCSSGIKSVMLAAQTIQAGHQDVVLAGGMESMSNVPYFMERGTTPFGAINLIDGIVGDGLTDVYNKIQIGDLVETTAKKMSITREEQDEHAISSYKRCAVAYAQNVFVDELVPVKVPQKKGMPDKVVNEDEEYKKVDFDKLIKLKPAFQKENGTITAGNTAGLTDGAAAIILATPAAAQRLNAKPLARIIGFCDAETNPLDMSSVPALAIQKLLEVTGVRKDEIALWEINEPFSAVPLDNIKKLGIDREIVNIHGGAVAIGHPFGMTGTRIVVHLAYVLKPGQKGVATTCNGGGGASAIMIERL